MSKSDGNFITIHELLAGVGRRPKPGEVVRLSILATHYRQPIDFTEAKLDYWWKKLSEWVSRFKTFGSEQSESNYRSKATTISPSTEIVDALSDDLNFQLVITHLDHLAGLSPNNSAAADELGANLIWLGLLRSYAADAFQTKAYGARPDLVQKYHDELKDACALALNFYDYSNDQDARSRSRNEVMGQMKQLNSDMAEDGVYLNVDEHFGVSLEPMTSASAKDERGVDLTISARLEALNAKDFAKADQIRAELLEQGIQLMDYKDPDSGERRTKWEIKR